MERHLLPMISVQLARHSWTGKKVSEVVEKNPEASISIIRNWLHEPA